jgi:hypothetical protein
MVLDRFGDDIDIRNLSFELPPTFKKEVMYDAEQDLTPEIWEAIYRVFWDDRLEGTALSDGPAQALVTLAPERRYELGLADEDWEGVVSQLDDPMAENFISEKGFEETYSGDLAMLKILFPERITELTSDLKIHKRLLGLYEYLTGRGETISDSLAMLRLASNTKLLYPQFPDDWNRETNMRGSHVYTNGLSLLGTYAKQEQWKQFSICARQMRLLFPKDTFELLESGFWKDQAWPGMRAALEKRREKNKNWEAYAYLAANMKILSAKQIIITDTELKLIMPDKPVQLDVDRSAEMPAERNF